MINHPNAIAISDYTYDLPADKIPNYPLSKRDESKLLVFKNKKISETIFKNIDELLDKGTVLIFNNTRVVQARLNFQNSSKQNIELFCLEPQDFSINISQAMLMQKNVVWKCLVGNLKKWRQEILSLNSNEICLSVKLIEKLDEFVIVEFNWDPPHLCFAEVLEKIGVVPIPPYFKRKSEEIDSTRYQTIYAQENGSVAAPTAGLHFTDNVIKKLQKNNTELLYVTLHVGAGTFKPVKSATISGHEMHAEWISVNKFTINQLLKNQTQQRIAVGTTSLRALESLYWLGMKIFYQPEIKLSELFIEQWYPYECTNEQISYQDSMLSLLGWLEQNNVDQIVCKTAILIAPPYKLKMVDGIITNFHQPQSTLLLLISCVVGENWQEIYRYALTNNFRFLSYGDSSLLFK